MSSFEATSGPGVEVLAIIVGTFLGGAIASIFLLTIPVLIETAPSAAALLYQWKRVFERGHIQGPAISIATACLYAYASYSKSLQSEQWRGFAVAGATTVAMIPYTWVFMRTINNQLWAAVRGEKETVGMPEAQGMLNTWSRLNMIRAMFPLAGGVLGLLSALGVLTL